MNQNDQINTLIGYVEEVDVESAVSLLSNS